MIVYLRSSSRSLRIACSAVCVFLTASCSQRPVSDSSDAGGDTCTPHGDLIGVYAGLVENANVEGTPTRSVMSIHFESRPFAPEAYDVQGYLRYDWAGMGTRIASVHFTGQIDCTRFIGKLLHPPTGTIVGSTDNGDGGGIVRGTFEANYTHYTLRGSWWAAKTR